MSCCLRCCSSWPWALCCRRCCGGSKRRTRITGNTRIALNVSSPEQSHVSSPASVVRFPRLGGFSSRPVGFLRACREFFRAELLCEREPSRQERPPESLYQPDDDS